MLPSAAPVGSSAPASELNIDRGSALTGMVGPVARIATFGMETNPVDPGLEADKKINLFAAVLENLLVPSTLTRPIPATIQPENPPNDTEEAHFSDNVPTASLGLRWDFGVSPGKIVPIEESQEARQTRVDPLLVRIVPNPSTQFLHPTSRAAEATAWEAVAEPISLDGTPAEKLSYPTIPAAHSVQEQGEAEGAERGNPVRFATGMEADLTTLQTRLAESRGTTMNSVAAKNAVSETPKVLLRHSLVSFTLGVVGANFDRQEARGGVISSHGTAPTASVWGPMAWDAAMSQIADFQAINLRTGNDREILVQLDPPHLGKVQIRLQESPDGTRGEIRTQNHEALQLIQSRLPELQRQFELRGLQPIHWAIVATSEPPERPRDREANLHQRETPVWGIEQSRKIRGIGGNSGLDFRA